MTTPPKPGEIETAATVRMCPICSRPITNPRSSCAMGLCPDLETLLRSARPSLAPLAQCDNCVLGFHDRPSAFEHCECSCCHSSEAGLHPTLVLDRAGMIEDLDVMAGRAKHASGQWHFYAFNPGQNHHEPFTFYRHWRQRVLEQEAECRTFAAELAQREKERR